MELFHNCSHSFLLASSKSGVRKEMREEKKAAIIYLSIYSQVQSNWLFKQGRFFIISQCQADNRGL